MDCFVFEAGGKCLGIEARYVYRVADKADLTPVPLLPPCHAGILYHRGELFDVIDLARLLKKGEAGTSGRHPRVILLRWDQRKLGLIPDRIIGVTWLDNETDRETAFTREGLPIHIWTPEAIWHRLSELPYGH